MDPITRKEMYLAKAGGADVALPVPVTREEMFLAKMAGQDVSVPAPITRMEMFLNAAAENAGGGAGGGELDAFIDGSLIEITSNAERIKNSAFYNHDTITTANFPNVMTIGSSAFYGCTNLTELDFPIATNSGLSAFYNCTNLVSVRLPNLIATYNSTFYGCKNLRELRLPALDTDGSGSLSDFCNSCHSLKTVDMGKQFTMIHARFFNKCYSLKSLILRCESVVRLVYPNAFDGCYHFLGTVNSTYNPDGLKDGYIYVPAALVDSYKAVTNWTVYADQLRALEDYTVDGTITGELDPAKTGVTV